MRRAMPLSWLAFIAALLPHGPALRDGFLTRRSSPPTSPTSVGPRPSPTRTPCRLLSRRATTTDLIFSVLPVHRPLPRRSPFTAFSDTSLFSANLSPSGSGATAEPDAYPVPTPLEACDVHGLDLLGPPRTSPSSPQPFHGFDLASCSRGPWAILGLSLSRGTTW